MIIISWEIFLQVFLAGYMALSHVVIPKAVLEVSKRSVKPSELKLVKSLIIVFSPVALMVILWSKKK